MLEGQQQSGFTLYELMIVLAIGSIILVVAVPSFSGVMDNQRMTAATNEMVMTLNLAKSEAIKRVAYVSVCKSNNGVNCSAAGTSWDSTTSRMESDPVSSIVRRSMPIPNPPAGGMPYSRALM